jgi:hypothetical protein
VRQLIEFALRAARVGDCGEQRVVTWPGALCYRGQRGCVVFCGVADFFEVLRKTGLFNALY